MILLPETRCPVAVSKNIPWAGSANQRRERSMEILGSGLGILECQGTSARAHQHPLSTHSARRICISRMNPRAAAIQPRLPRTLASFPHFPVNFSSNRVNRRRISPRGPVNRSPNRSYWKEHASLDPRPIKINIPFSFLSFSFLFRSSRCDRCGILLVFIGRTFLCGRHETFAWCLRLFGCVCVTRSRIMHWRIYEFIFELFALWLIFVFKINSCLLVMVYMMLV